MKRLLVVGLLVILTLTLLYTTFSANPDPPSKYSAQEIAEIREESSDEYCEEACDWKEGCVEEFCNVKE